MTINKLLLGLTTLVGVALLWLVAGLPLPQMSAQAAVRAPVVVPAGQRATSAQIARLERLNADERLLSVVNVTEIVGRRDLRGVSGACVEALSRRADQLRRQQELIERSTPMPVGQDDTCRAAENSALIGTSGGSRPRLHAKRVRLFAQSGAAWMNYDVREACGRWLEPDRLNVEEGGEGTYQRLWCG